MNGQEKMRFLVVIETQKVKAYLFASPILRETRGASALLDWLNRKRAAEILNRYEACRVIYLGGGSGRILFGNRTDADEFQQELLDAYRKETVNARVSVEVVEREVGADGKDESVGEWMRRGVGMSQQRKLGRIEAVPVGAGRWIRPCSSCGLEPAQKPIEEHGRHYLCRSCLLKRAEVRDNLYDLVKPGEGAVTRVLKSDVKLADRYTENSIFVTLKRFVRKKTALPILLPQTFGDIGNLSRPANYMGFIYADGNRMGETVKKLGEMFPGDEEARAAYQAFSEIVDQATREAAVESVLETVGMVHRILEDGSAAVLIPAEFILAGGDDLMLAVPAHHALDVTLRFIEGFRKKTVEIQKAYKREGKLVQLFEPHGLTTSAGVVIAHAHYPASDLMTIAAQLMKMAKKKAAMLEKDEGTLDFIVLSESGSEEVKQRRSTEYDSKRWKIRLTERPYTHEDAVHLLEEIRGLKRSRLPRTKLKALYPVLFQSPMQAQFDALRIKERLKVTGDLNGNPHLLDLVNRLHFFPFRSEKPDGPQKDQTWTTPMTEIIELYDFIQPGKEGENGTSIELHTGV